MCTLCMEDAKLQQYEDVLIPTRQQNTGFDNVAFLHVIFSILQFKKQTNG